MTGTDVVFFESDLYKVVREYKDLEEVRNNRRTKNNFLEA